MEEIFFSVNLANEKISKTMSYPAPAVASPAAEKVASPPKKAAKSTSAKPKKPKAAKTYPPVSDMVVAAGKTLKERGGSSLQAIKKYLAAQYKVDVEMSRSRHSSRSS